jgi:hypothetical protein
VLPLPSTPNPLPGILAPPKNQVPIFFNGPGKTRKAGKMILQDRKAMFNPVFGKKDGFDHSL